MRFEHRFSLPASRSHAEAVLARPDLVAPCFPGLTLRPLGEWEHAGSLKVKLGPYPMVYAGTVSVTERRERLVRLLARGTDRNGRSEAELTLRIDLAAKPETTDVHLTAELSVTGRPAGLGEEPIRLVAERLSAQFVDCLVRRLPDIDPSAPAASSPREGLGEQAGPPEVAPRAGVPGPPVAARRAGGPSTLVRRPGWLALGASLLAITLGLVRRWRR